MRERDGQERDGKSAIRSFYDQMAPQYDKLFLDWSESVREQAAFLDRIFREHGFGPGARVLDCACGIGTQAIGLAARGYAVTGSDLSAGALAEAEKRAAQAQVPLRLAQADFCSLQTAFSERFDVVIAMDNALPHMLTREALESAVGSICARLAPGGLFAASIRDYDRLLEEKPRCSVPYIHRTANGQRVSFQTWDWTGDRYHFIQYIIDDEGAPQLGKFECDYRALRREELSGLLTAAGCREPRWLSPEESGYYQPVVVARKQEK